MIVTELDFLLFDNFRRLFYITLVQIKNKAAEIIHLKKRGCFVAKASSQRRKRSPTLEFVIASGAKQSHILDTTDITPHMTNHPVKKSETTQPTTGYRC